MIGMKVAIQVITVQGITLIFPKTKTILALDRIPGNAIVCLFDSLV